MAFIITCGDCNTGYRLGQLTRTDQGHELIYQCPNCYNVVARKPKDSPEV